MLGKSAMELTAADKELSSQARATVRSEGEGKAAQIGRKPLDLGGLSFLGPEKSQKITPGSAQGRGLREAQLLSVCLSSEDLS